MPRRTATGPPCSPPPVGGLPGGTPRTIPTESARCRCRTPHASAECKHGCEFCYRLGPPRNENLECASLDTLAKSRARGARTCSPQCPGTNQHPTLDTPRRRTRPPWRQSSLRGSVRCCTRSRLRTPSALVACRHQMTPGRSRTWRAGSKGARMRRRDKRRRLKKASARNNTSIEGNTAAAREARNPQDGDRHAESRRPGTRVASELTDGPARVGHAGGVRGRGPGETPIAPQRTEHMLRE